MPWLDDILHELEIADRWGYHAGHPTATEPAAFAALALMAHGDADAAARPLEWLNEHQAENGSLGVTADQASPGWPTSLALLAWLRADKLTGSNHYAERIDRAVRWTLAIAGKPLDRWEDIGHDTMLVGWPWVEGTHSWLEPTAFAVLALKATGRDDHPRTREAVRLIIDRLLPDGGCNYGNTFVLGQRLRPQIEPSGIALAAAAGEEDRSGRLARTTDYVHDALSPNTTAASLSFGLLGLGATGRTPSAANMWLEAAARRALERDRSPYKLALLTLAAVANDKPLQP